jgi:hypothetical protein
MTHKVGTDLGGIRNVERLRERCVVDPETGCWHWKLAKTALGRPAVNLIHPVTGRRRKLPGTRAAWILANGRDVPEGRIVRLRCRSMDCCNPEHVKCTTRKEWGQHMAKIGANKPDPVRHLTLVRRGLQFAKLNMEIAREIRASPLPAREEALRRGVCQSTITAVRRNERWKERAPVIASVFDLGGLAA